MDISLTNLEEALSIRRQINNLIRLRVYQTLSRQVLSAFSPDLVRPSSWA